MKESARAPYIWLVWSRLIAAVDKLKGNKFKKRGRGEKVTRKPCERRG